MDKSIIERLESAVGKISAYDGRLVVWTSTGSYDIRDILRFHKVKGVTLADAMDALVENDAEASKARRAAVRAVKENAE
jgi:hypothetical protein